MTKQVRHETYQIENKWNGNRAIYWEYNGSLSGFINETVSTAEFK
jgi:hypothetical protein